MTEKNNRGDFVVLKENMLKGFVIVNAFMIVGLAFLVYSAVAQEGEEVDMSICPPVTATVGYGLSRAAIAFAAALSVGIACLGAALGVGVIGSSAVGAIAEKKEVATWSFMFIALAEGVAFYGLIIAFMLVGKL